MVKVTPNASQNRIEGFHNNILKVKIKAPPDKGKANEELIKFLAKTFHIPKQKIEILSGHTSRLKKLKIDSEIDFVAFFSTDIS